MQRILIPIILALTSMHLCYAAGASPSVKQMQSLLGTKEDINIEAISEIKLKSGEEAYLLGVMFPDRGRNFMQGAILFRPRLKEAKELNGQIGASFQIVSNQSSGLSLVLTKASGSGQGTVEGIQSLVYFDEWSPVTILSEKFGDNLGNCGFPEIPICRSRSVEWEFDVKSSEKIKILETVTEETGKSPEKLKIKQRRLRKYLLNELKLERTN